MYLLDTNAWVAYLRHNTGEFGRISGLALDDWLSP
jgi:hypothetical protein